MSALVYFSFIIVYFFYFGLLALPFFRPAGRKPWEALIPVYNVYVMTRIIDRPWWWVLLAILPVVNNIMMIVILFEILHVYRLGTFKNILIAILTLGIYFTILGYQRKLEYQGRDIKEIRRHISELAASIIFAVVAATAIRSFTFEAFTIPTPSMEKSLLVGDFLFVSKLAYGVRIPMTPFSVPLVHNHVPFSSTINSYAEVELPYLRLPALQNIEQNDPVVFNYPAEDIRYAQFGMEGEVRPIDKREHYVKRAIGLPGDVLEIKNAQVYINGELNQLPNRVHKQYLYRVLSGDQPISDRVLERELEIQPETAVEARFPQPGQTGEQMLFVNLTEAEAAQLEQFAAVRKIEIFMPGPHSENPVFPNPPHEPLPFPNWDADNYGPLYIPVEGESIELNEENYYKYRRVIGFYEGNDFEYRQGKFYVNGTEAKQYTFRQNYYFMMGDNRHRSDDSRYWGFVPEDHIVGKPVFIWMSFDKYGRSLMDKIRWERVFTTVSGEGPRRSYFWPFAILVGGVYFFNRFRKKKRKAKAA